MFIFLNCSIFSFIFLSFNLLFAKFTILNCPNFSFFLKMYSTTNSFNLLLLKFIRLQCDKYGINFSNPWDVNKFDASFNCFILRIFEAFWTKYTISVSFRFSSDNSSASVSDFS